MGDTRCGVAPSGAPVHRRAEDRASDQARRGIRLRPGLRGKGRDQVPSASARAPHRPRPCLPGSSCSRRCPPDRTLTPITALARATEPCQPWSSRPSPQGGRRHITQPSPAWGPTPPPRGARGLPSHPRSPRCTAPTPAVRPAPMSARHTRQASTQTEPDSARRRPRSSSTPRSTSRPAWISRTMPAQTAPTAPPAHRAAPARSGWRSGARTTSSCCTGACCRRSGTWPTRPRRWRRSSTPCAGCSPNARRTACRSRS